MHATYFEIVPHDDIARLDLEDGLIRNAAAALIANASTIDEIIVDVPRQRSIELGASGADSASAPAMCIVAAELADTKPDLDDLLVEVATVSTSWPATISTLLEVDQDWPGPVTPGVKLRLSASAAPGIDGASFATWITDSLHRCADRCEDLLAVTALQPASDDDGPDALSVIGTLSFRDDAALDAALSSAAFAPFAESEMIAPESLRAAAVSEHRIRPNPNTWT